MRFGNTLTYNLFQLPKELSADGNALVNSLQQLAGAAGTAVAASIVSASRQHTASDWALGTTQGSRYVMLPLSLLLFLALAVVVRIFRK